MNWDPLSIAGAITASAGALAALAWAGRTLWRIGKTVGDLRDDFLGEPSRPGVKGRPGLMERVAGIETELHPNGGSSMRDAINRTEVGLGAVSGELASLRAEFAAHLAEHSRNPVTVNVGTNPSTGGTP